MSAPCRHCGAPLRVTFCDLGSTPLANAYPRPGEAELRHRLHAYVCGSCFLVQLEDVETPQAIFSDYAYFSSYSDSWLAHARAYVAMAVDRFGLTDRSRVIEVASNDGYLLQYMAARGIPCLGIEPAENVARVARDKGIETLCAFFDEDLAGRLARDGRKADLIVGNNVLAHVPDPNGFARALARAMRPGGAITMEFPHLLRLMADNQFDTIYHEHFSYISLAAAERIFGAAGLKIWDVEELPTHGGSLRIFATHRDDTRGPTDRLAAVRAAERGAGLDRLETYAAFAAGTRATRDALRRFLETARAEGRQVAGYGAPAKGATLLNFCGAGPDLVSYTVDRNPEKQGRSVPGTGIPIHPPDRIDETRPDYVLILPWNLAEEITAQMAHIRDWGGRFVVPIPEPRVLP